MNADATPAPRRHKRWLRVLWGCLALSVACVALWCWAYYSALAERDRMIADLHRRGAAVWWPELAERELDKSSAASGAKLYLEAIGAVGGEYNPKGIRVPTQATEDMLEKLNYKPGVYPEVESELKIARKSLELAAEAVKRPPGLLTTALRTPNPVAILLPHIQNARSLSRVVRMDVVDALGKKDGRRAYRAALLSFRISEQLAEEPILISQLVRIAMSAVATESLRSVVEHEPPTEAEFRALDELLARLEREFSWKLAGDGERAMMMTALDDPQNFRELLTITTVPAGSPTAAFVRRQWQELIASPFGLPVKIRAQIWQLELSELTAELLDRPRPWPAEKQKRYDELVDSSPLQKLKLMDKMDFLAVRTINTAGERYRRRLLFARWALRLAHHRFRTGALPEKLDAICDAAMPTIDTAWFGGQPISYTRTEKGFRLEAPDDVVGAKSRDEKKTFGGLCEVDFVWPAKK